MDYANYSESFPSYPDAIWTDPYHYEQVDHADSINPADLDFEELAQNETKTKAKKSPKPT